MASVNFRGVEGAVTAYETRALPTWAIFDKKNLMQSGETADNLRSYLELLEEHGSNTVYTLKVYKNLSADDVTDKAESNGAFTFILSDSRAAYMGGMGYMGAGNNSLLGRIAALEKELKEAKEPAEKQTIGSVVMGWLQDPEDVVRIIGAITQGVALLKGKPALQLAGTQSGPESFTPPQGPTDDSPKNEYGLTDEQMKQQLRIANALQRLQAKDPEIVTHLEQLANLAEKNPAMFQIAIGMLKSY